MSTCADAAGWKYVRDTTEPGFARKTQLIVTTGSTGEGEWQLLNVE